MSKVEENVLVIRIPDSEPKQLQNNMIKDVGAMIRWYSTSDGKQTKDEGTLFRLGMFLDALASSG